MSVDLMLEELREKKSAVALPAVISPRGFEPGVQYLDGKPSVITTTATTEQLNTEDDFRSVVAQMGVPLPEGYTLRLIEARYDEAAWTREAPGEAAVTAAVWRYKFAVELSIGGSDDIDLAQLAKEARKSRTSSPKKIPSDTSLIVVLGDPQIGKVDRRGGTLELLKRLEGAKAQVLDQVKKVKPAELVLLDVGDSVEMFESAPGAERTNDLQATEQIRMWRRIFWSWIKDLAPLTPSMKVMAVPSNHCSVRRGKQNLSTPGDDWGIEVLTQVADIAAENETAYGHVEFLAPDTFSESLALELVGGKVLGAAHGHQKSSPTQFASYLAGQALGRTPVGHADITVFGHFHNLRVETIGDDRWFFVAPTIDSGSSWYANTTGNESRAGVLTFVVDAEGWRDLFVAWSD